MIRKITLQIWFMIAAIIHVYPQSGTLVKSFGDSGIRHIRFDRVRYSDDYGGIIKTDTSGKILIAGTSANGTKRDICIARMNTDGSLDTTFSHGGKLLIPAGTGIIDQTLTFNVDGHGHGNILLAGQIDSSGYFLMRMDGNGRPDPGFGTKGRVALTEFNGLIQQINIYFDSQERIILGGTSLASPGVILRLNSGGTIDSTFGTDGKVLFQNGNPFVLQTFTVDLKDRILLAGMYKCGPGDKAISALRLTSDGIIDSTFGETGTKGRAQFYPYDDYDNPIAKMILVDSLDRILIGITTGHDWPWTVLVRLNESGSADPSFGGGKVILEKLRQLTGIAVDRNGKLFLAGPGEYPYGSPEYSKNKIYCLKNDGTPDSSFGVSGVYSDGTFSEFPKSNNELPKFYQKSLLLDHDEKILWAGTAIYTNNLDFRITRLSGFGKEDINFNGTGTVWINGNDSLRYSIAEQGAATSLIMDLSGRTIMAGYSRNTNEGIWPETYDYSIVRLDTGGNPDLTFNNSGSILIPALNDHPAVPQIACDENYKILISGRRFNHYFVQRFNENGDPDSAFGSNSSVLLPDMYPSERVLIDIDTTGRIWLFMEGGYLYDCIFRLTPDGLLDTTFNRTGYLGTGSLAISKIYRSDNGYLYVLGSFPLEYHGHHPKVLKINDWGIIDTIMDVKITRSGRYYVDESGDGTADEEIRLKYIGSSMTSSINACMNDSIFISVSSNTWGDNWMSTLLRGIIRETPDTVFTRDVKTETLYGRHYNAMVADCDYFWLAGQDSAQTCFMISKHYARDNQTISFSLPDTMFIGDPPQQLNGAASSGLPVNYSGTNTGVAQISHDTLTIVGEGTATITASQPGNGIFYAADPVIRNLQVNRIVTDIQNPEPGKDIKTYPNPFSDILCLESPVKIKSVVITGLEGNVMYENSLVNANYLSLDMSEFKAGCYLISVQLDDNSPSRVRKIIKL
jgi:uncharacterized delta-60 repeat protein